MYTHYRSGLRRAPVAAVFAAAVLLGVLALAGPALAAPPPSSVSDQLICLCGCNSVLTECPHQDCGWGIPAKQYISQQLDTGASPESIVEYFVQKEGEQVLAAPTKSGFNLIAWVLPFVALAIGAVAIYYLVVRWSAGRREPEAVPAEVMAPTPTSSETARRLDEELRDFD